MLEFDKKSNLLMTNRYQYSLQDVAEPNLYRELYDYESIPKVAFNMRHVPENMPDEIWMTDTTFRDGQQSVSPFTVEQIVHLYSLMHRLGGPKGLIRQSEFFLYTDKDKKALHACQDLGYDFPEITTWIRANEKDFELVKQAGVKETGILVSCSDYHIFKKMHLTRKQAMDKYLGIVKAALDRGIRPRCHFEDITRADFYGFVLPFAEELMYLSEESGLPIKIRTTTAFACSSTLATRWRTRWKTRWATACITMVLPCRAPSPASSTVCTTTRAYRRNSWSGTVTTTSTRSSATRVRRGCTAARRSTARCWA